MQPQVDPMVLLAPWFVWGALIIGLTLITFVGTWLILRRWKNDPPIFAGTCAYNRDGGRIHHRHRDFLLISVILGFLGKKKWKTFDEYLVGKRDIGPIITGCAFRHPTSRDGLFVEAPGLSTRLDFQGCGLPVSGVSRPHSLHLAGCPEDKRFFGQTQSRYRAGNNR